MTRTSSKTHRARIASIVAAAALTAALAGCVAPVGPIEVTRFHAPDIAALGHGTIAIVAAPGSDENSLEIRSYEAAVARQLTVLGYTEAPAATAQTLATVHLDRRVVQPQRARGPVSVGIGGSTGSYGSGVGLGVGIDLSGKPPEQIQTELTVSIRDRANGTALWEGRANFAVRASSPLADTQLGAARLAEALFKNFPGRSGETIEVR